MNTFKQTLLGRILPSTLAIFFLCHGCASIPQRQFTETIIDSVEEIIVYTKSGPVKVLAKIDTGARSSSVDSTFAQKHGLSPYVGTVKNVKCPDGQKYIKSAIDGQCRDRVVLSFNLRGNFHYNPATVSDRRNLQTVVLIGRRDIIGKYIVRPISHKGIQDDAEAEEEEKD